MKTRTKRSRNFKDRGGFMTEDKMRERMIEIDEEREKLKVERQKYENYFSDKKKKEMLNNHITFEGKCFHTKDLSNNEHKYIKAFKILHVLSEPNEKYGKCIAIIDGHRNSCWHEFGIQGMILPLWTKNTLKLTSKKSDPKMIDMYEEISEEEFRMIYINYKQEIEEKIFG